MTLKVLFFGDIVGEVGRKALLLSLPSLRRKYGADFVIANEENVYQGKGLDEASYLSLKEAGVDCVTLGNHYRSERSIDSWIDKYDDILRPMNVLSYHHGEGSHLFKIGDDSLRVSCYMGSAFMKEKVENPFLAIKRNLAHRNREMHIIDFHADSTSEKVLFWHCVKGQVSAVIGTHTHVQTADKRITEGTAFLTDVGMCGDAEGVIGSTLESVLPNFIENKQTPFLTRDKGKAILSYCYLEINVESRETVLIENHIDSLEVE